MKKIVTITVAILAAVSMFSCKDDSPEPEKPEVSTLLKANPDGLTFGANDKDTQLIFVTSLNVEWTADVEVSAQDWLKITPESGKVIVRVEENTSEQNRTGKITITPDKETMAPAVITVTQSPTQTLWISTHLAAYTFKGDAFGCGIANYLVELFGGDAIYDETKGKVSMSEGYYLVMELLATDLTRPDFYKPVEVKTGTFHASLDPANPGFKYNQWTFLRTYQRNSDLDASYWYGSFLIRFSGGNCAENIKLIGGRVVVEGESGNNRVMADLVTETNQRIVVEYSGPFDKVERRAVYCTYNKDRNITGLSKGTLEFYGEDAEYAPGTHSWGVDLQTPELAGGADLQLALHSPMTSTTFLETGDYTIQTSYPLTDFTAEPGYSLFGYPYATWIFEYNKSGKYANHSPLIGGTISVTHNGGNNYTITADALMSNYLKLTASFEGDLTYVDKSGAAAASGFQGIPFKMENREGLAVKIPARNDRSVYFRPESID